MTELQDFKAALYEVEKTHGPKIIDSGDVDAIRFHFRLCELITDITVHVVSPLLAGQAEKLRKGVEAAAIFVAYGGDENLAKLKDALHDVGALDHMP